MSVLEVRINQQHFDNHVCLLPNKDHLQEALLLCCKLKKSADKSHLYRKITCRVHLFKVEHFDLNDKEHGNWPRTIQNHQLQALLDVNDSQWHKMLANCSGENGEVAKNRKIVPHELNVRQKKPGQNTSCSPAHIWFKSDYYN